MGLLPTQDSGAYIDVRLPTLQCQWVVVVVVVVVVSGGVRDVVGQNGGTCERYRGRETKQNGGGRRIIASLMTTLKLVLFMLHTDYYGERVGTILNTTHSTQSHTKT